MSADFTYRLSASFWQTCIENCRLRLRAYVTYSKMKEKENIYNYSRYDLILRDLYLKNIILEDTI
jgi:hypothetical protein